MDFNIEQLKKKIFYRSNYRGTKEMDKLLGAFTKKYINELIYTDLLDLEKLLNIDDDNLFNFFSIRIHFCSLRILCVHWRNFSFFKRRRYCGTFTFFKWSIKLVYLFQYE